MKYPQGILSGTLMISVMLIVGPVACLSQEPTWTGQVQCQVSIQSNGYTHRETQTWKLTGAPATMSGAIAVYPAVWSVSGEGTVQRTVNAQVVSGLWKTTVAPTNTNLAFFVRSKRLVIKSYHAQVYAPAAIVGTQQLAIPGAAPTQRTVQNAAYEWQLPVIEDSAASTSVSGSGTVTVSGNVVSLQATPNGTATCEWQFTKGGGAGSVPQTQLAAVPRVIQPTATVAAQVPTLNRGGGASAGVAAGAAGATAGSGAAGEPSSSGAAGAAVVPGAQGAVGGAAAGAAGQSSADAGGAAAATSSAINYAGDASGGAAAPGSAAAGAGGAAGAAPGSAAGASGNSSAATTGGSSGSSNQTIVSLPQGPLQENLVPSITQVGPNSVMVGQFNRPIAITGSFTHFAQGLTSVSFGAPGLITVTSVKVDSPTSLTAFINVTLPPLNVPLPVAKFDITVDTGQPLPANGALQGASNTAHEVVSLPAAFAVTPALVQQHNTLATFSPNTGQQGQSMTVTITGTDTNFAQGVTQIQQSPLSTPRISAPSLTVNSPTTATATFTILPAAMTGTSMYMLEIVTNTGQMVETTLGDFTITPAPDSYSHGPNPTSGADISTTTPQTFDGQLASLTGEDWFWFECDATACTVSLQNVTAPTNIVVDVLDTQGLLVNSTAQQGGSPMKLTGYEGCSQNVNAGCSSGAYGFFFLRVHATAWDVSKPTYRLVLTGVSQ